MVKVTGDSADHNVLEVGQLPSHVVKKIVKAYARAIEAVSAKGIV